MFYSNMMFCPISEDIGVEMAQPTDWVFNPDILHIWCLLVYEIWIIFVVTKLIRAAWNDAQSKYLFEEVKKIDLNGFKPTISEFRCILLMC